MISSLLGKKLGMTQVYDAQNVLVPVTVVEAGPCPVVQVKTVEKDGYNAVQIGFSSKKPKNTSAGEMGHAKASGLEIAPRLLSEIRSVSAPTLKVGDMITVAAFAEGQFVDVSGVTKGKGFQGVVKRFRVAGGPATHGSMFHRRIGSIGMRRQDGSGKIKQCQAIWAAKPARCKISGLLKSLLSKISSLLRVPSPAPTATTSLFVRPSRDNRKQPNNLEPPL